MTEDDTLEVETPERVETMDLADILESENMADTLAENVLTRIGSQVIRDFGIDETSRADWLDRYHRVLDVAMQVRKAKTFPWANAFNVKYPLLTTAAVQFQARAYPAIVDGSNLVKGRVLGPDPDGMKRARADRIAAHMTWQLLYRMPGWEDDTDKLLLMLPITGCVFRKTYYDPISASNRSDMIAASDFVVNYWAKSLSAAPRYTHILKMYPHEAQERINSGLWRKVSFDEPKDADDDDSEIEFYEQHRLIDIDGDGYPEPYVVTCNKMGEIARLVPCFGIEDVTIMALDQNAPARLVDMLRDGRAQAIGEIVRIERRQYFTKYGFIPAPDGSFYDMGFGALLDDISATIDATLNQMLDAGALQNAQGGFVGSGVNLKGGDMRFRLGEWKRVDTTGGTLRDNILPLQLNGPSAVLFNLLGMLIESAKEITSVQNVLTGEGTANQPATTTLALIEQGQKVMTGIFKRVFRSFTDELLILKRLNRDYLNENEYFQLNDSEEAQQVERADYEDDDLDVLPSSDPTAVSDMQKMGRAQAAMVFNGDPLVNQGELRRRYFEAIGERDIKALLTVDEAPAAPDPKIIEAGARLALEKEKTGAVVRASDATAANVLADAATKLVGLGLVHDAVELAAAATELGGTADDEPTPESGAIPSVEGPPADEGIPQDAAGPAIGSDAGMGAGVVDDGGAAGAGGLAGPASGPVA